jgi:RNA polymerase-binding transcription factor DksA
MPRLPCAGDPATGFRGKPLPSRLGRDPAAPRKDTPMPKPPSKAARPAKPAAAKPAAAKAKPAPAAKATAAKPKAVAAKARPVAEKPKAVAETAKAKAPVAKAAKPVVEKAKPAAAVPVKAKPVAAKPAAAPAAKPAAKPVPAKAAPVPVRPAPVIPAPRPAARAAAKSASRTRDEAPMAPPAACPFTPAELKEWRDILLKARAQYSDDIQGLQHDAMDSEGGHTTPIHSAERGSDADAQDVALNIAGDEKNTLWLIDRALRKIDEGKPIPFGVCEHTRQAISRNRLQLMPWTPLSIEGAQYCEDAGVAPDEVLIDD